MKIILDTNFIMIPSMFKIDIFSEIDRICDFNYDLCVVDKTVDELDKVIKEQRGKFKIAARLALIFIKNKGIKIIKTKSDGIVDDIIVELAEKDKMVVATQDKGLRERLKEKGVNLIGMRQKKQLFIDKIYNL